MCGIVGLIAKRQQGFFGKELDIFKALLVNDSQRGEDSTGAVCAMSNGKAHALKTATIPHLMYMTEEWVKFEVTQNFSFVHRGNSLRKIANVPRSDSLIHC